MPVENRDEVADGESRESSRSRYQTDKTIETPGDLVELMSAISAY